MMVDWNISGAEYITDSTEIQLHTAVIHTRNCNYIVILYRDNVLPMSFNSEIKKYIIKA